MGRPIKDKWFGDDSLPGSQIIVNGIKWADGSTSLDGSIVKQTGSTAYVVTNGTKTERCFLANADDVTDLLPGQCFILATPFGGSSLPCRKIAQFRLSVFETVGDPKSKITSYSWSTIPAVKSGEADLITDALPGAILTLVLDTPGFGYFTAPAVSFTGGGTGATAHSTVANGTVTGLVLDTSGSGYTSGGVTIAAAPAAVTATGTVVLTADVITSVTLGVGGGYYTSAPTVTVIGDGSGAVITATVANGTVTGYVVTNGGTGYTSATISVAAPAASSTATAHATV